MGRRIVDGQRVSVCSPQPSDPESPVPTATVWPWAAIWAKIAASVVASVDVIADSQAPRLALTTWARSSLAMASKMSVGPLPPFGPS